MLTVTNGGKTVGGKTLEAYLREELAAFRKGGTDGNTLLGPILDGSTGYEVVIKDSAPTATSGTRVTINPKETNIATATDTKGLREFVESTIFELTNASNADAFRALDTGLVNGKAVLAYGREKANLEAQASWAVSAILQQRSGYEPSDWGKKQIKECSRSSTLDGFSETFRKAAHDSTGTGAASLSSAEYYAFNGAYKVGGAKSAFDRQFDALSVKGKKVTIEQLKNKLTTVKSADFNSMNMASVKLYHVVVDVLLSPPAELKVELKWRGTASDRAFSDAMKRIAVDTGNLLKNDVIRALPNATVA